jgi:hypothetical protein
LPLRRAYAEEGKAGKIATAARGGSRGSMLGLPFVNRPFNC